MLSNIVKFYFGRVLSFLPGGNSELEPPDTIPNSEVKRLSADDSVDLSM